AIIVVGKYAHKERGQLILGQDKAMVEVPSGTTLIFPSGTKHFSFAAVAPHETRYLFRQYCDAVVIRWIQKGSLSDAEFEALA
ncbi:hypothetical protein B0H17DRAFT_911239, partial [Mycena rosella]